MIQCYFHSNVDVPLKVRTVDYLGHLIDELEEFGNISLIEEFVSGGQKLCVLCFLPLDRKTYDQM